MEKGKSNDGKVTVDATARVAANTRLFHTESDMSDYVVVE